MVAAQRFNAEKGNDIPRVYGATTTGLNWLFLKLEGKQLHIDMAAYVLERCDKVLTASFSLQAALKSRHSRKHGGTKGMNIVPYFDWAGTRTAPTGKKVILLDAR